MSLLWEEIEMRKRPETTIKIEKDNLNIKKICRKELCPDCGGMVRPDGRCSFCPHCGWSSCP